MVSRVILEDQPVSATSVVLGPIPLDIYDANAQVTWVLSMSNQNGATGDVEVTVDNLLDASVSAKWVDSVSAISTDRVGNITMPISGIRYISTAVSGGGTNVSFRVLQSGVV